MNAANIAAEVRRIQHALDGYVPMYEVRGMLDRLERDIAPDTPAAYACPVEGFDTVLSYLSKHDQIILELAHDPVRDFIVDGKNLAKCARNRGLPVLRVAAPEAVSVRYRRVTHVNAYPTHLLAEYFA